MAVKKWNEDFILEAYDLARSGMCEKEIATVLGIKLGTLNQWKRNKKQFKKALVKGRVRRHGKHRTPTQEFHHYVFQRLDDRLKETWEKIQAVEDEENGVLRLERILENEGEQARQHLFLYALTACNFNPSEALRKIGMARKELEKWTRDDPDFAALVEEIHWHKKNFFEGGLVRLCREGVPSAIIFANKCFNKDRGYTDKIDISIDHQSGEKLITNTPVDQLELPVDTRKELLVAMRRHKLENAPQEEAE